MTLEEIKEFNSMQQKILEYQEQINKLSKDNDNYKNLVEESKKTYSEMEKTLNDTRQRNMDLFLQVEAQKNGATLPPAEEEKEEPKAPQIYSAEDLTQIWD